MSLFVKHPINNACVKVYSTNNSGVPQPVWLNTRNINVIHKLRPNGKSNDFEIEMTTGYFVSVHFYIDSNDQPEQIAAKAQELYDEFVTHVATYM